MHVGSLANEKRGNMRLDELRKEGCNTIRYDPKRSDPIKYTTRCDPKRYDTIRYEKIRYNARGECETSCTNHAECNIPCNGHMQTLQDQLQKSLRKVEWRSPFRNDCNEFSFSIAQCNISPATCVATACGTNQ